MEEEWTDGLDKQKCGFQLDPMLLLKSALYPIQGLTHILHFIDRILTWTQTALAFAITTGLLLFSMLNALYIYIIPWLWTKRAFVSIIPCTVAACLKITETLNRNCNTKHVNASTQNTR